MFNRRLRFRGSPTLCAYLPRDARRCTPRSSTRSAPLSSGTSKPPRPPADFGRTSDSAADSNSRLQRRQQHFVRIDLRTATEITAAISRTATVASGAEFWRETLTNTDERTTAGLGRGRGRGRGRRSVVHRMMQHHPFSTTP